MKINWHANRTEYYNQDTGTPVAILTPVSRRLTIRILDLLSYFPPLFINLVGYYYYLIDIFPKGSSIENTGCIIIL